MSLLLVVLGFGARRRCNLCVVDFFVGSPFCPLCLISSAADFLVFFVFGVLESGKCLRRGRERKRECTGATCGSLGGRMLAASLDFCKDGSALEADERW